MGAGVHPIDTEGVWCQSFCAVQRGAPALFLDRDGVVVEETEYLCKIADIQVIDGAPALIAAANKKSIPVVMVTNQAGIGRGYYDWNAFAEVQHEIIDRLAAQGARLDAVYACPHHPQGRGAFAHPDHPARKPNPGMLTSAAADLGLDLSRSWLVGDKVSDIAAAKAAGLAGGMIVRTGYGRDQQLDAAALGTPAFEVRVGDTLADAEALPIFAGRD